jgi:hypothetical protein
MRVAENYFAGHDDLAKQPIANQNPKKGIAYQVPARIVISRPSDDSVSVARTLNLYPRHLHLSAR